MPFNQTALTHPLELDFGTQNHFELQSGALVPLDDIMESLDYLRTTDPDTPIVITRMACHMAYFYSDDLWNRIICLPHNPIPQTSHILLTLLQDTEAIYFMTQGFKGAYQLGMPEINSEQILITGLNLQHLAYHQSLWRITLKEPQE